MITNNQSRNVFLVGFMGAGKSTVGPIVARRLDTGMVDTDDLVVAEVGESIPSIFENRGEQDFREREHEALLSSIEREERIIALGGGTPMSSENWSLIRGHGNSFYLQLPAVHIYHRVKNDTNRPLLNGLSLTGKLKKICCLLQKRRSRYRQSDYIIDTPGLDPSEIANKIVYRLEEK